MSQIAKVFELNRKGLNAARGVTVAVTMLLPPIVLTALHLEHYWISLSFGALFVWLSDPGGDYGSRVRDMAVVGVIGALLVAWDSGTAVRLLIGVLVFAGVTVWQVRIIAGSRYPGVRAAEALALGHPVVPDAICLDVLRDGTGPGGGFHPAADPHGRLVLHGDRFLDGGVRGHHRQI